MKCEQLELMKVIQFPKNRNIEIKKNNDKFDTAVKFLKFLVDEGADYHIIVCENDAEKLFEGKTREYTVITSNAEKAKGLKFNDNNFTIYPISGDELDLWEGIENERY